ncbi:MAG TPA: CopG family transcriptional regulator [Actinospica sp.]|nr:CopG family transcriptional regulator [Actinospica sp.]
MRKTSVYLDDAQADRLARLAVREGRSQAEILRDAVAAYEPPAVGDREFEVAAGFARIDQDPRPISQILEAALFDGFGA